jgi:hypothetical protein
VQQGGPIQAPRPPAQPGTIADTVARLRCGPGGGSCVAIAYDQTSGMTLFATAAHMVEGHPPVAEIPNQATVTGAWLDVDSKADLALFMAPTHAITTATVAAVPPQPGSTVWKAGYPAYNQCQLDVRAGTVQQAGEELWCNLDFRPGDSGGGIFDQQGQLVGIVSAYNTRQPSQGTGGSVGPIRRLIQRVRWPDCCLPWRRRSSPSPAIPPSPGAPYAPPSTAPPSISPPPQTFPDRSEELIQKITSLESSISDFRTRGIATLQRIDKIEATLNALSSRPGASGVKGDIGERGPVGAAGQAGKDGQDGKPGRDGASVDMNALAALIEQKINAALAAQPKPSPGQPPQRVRVVPRDHP